MLCEALDEDILQDKQQSKDIHRFGYLTMLTAQEVYHYIGYHTEQDPIRDGVGEWHHNNTYKGWYGLRKVVPLNLCHRLQHKQSHDDKRWRGGSSRDREEEWREEESNSKTYRYGERCKS